MLLRTRLLSLAIILIIGFVLLVSLLLNVALGAVLKYAESSVPVPPLLLSGAEVVLSLIIVTVLFAVIFKVLPDAVVDWRDVWVGAAITAILFIAGRFLIASYLAYTRARFSLWCGWLTRIDPALGVLSSLILFFGAALTKARVVASGKAVVPRAMAVRVKEAIVEEDAPPASREDSNGRGGAVRPGGRAYLYGPMVPFT